MAGGGAWGGARRGLVIGKFYPPHRGHTFLIDTGRAQVDELTVIVCDRPEQSIPGELRARWLREIHPGVRVLAVEDRLPADDSKAWADFTRSTLGYVPDVVFTSEAYGDAYARHRGARHVLVDRERSAVPMSGTAVRRDPLGAWAFLEPCVRAHFAVRVVVLGAESTGTTTVARALASHYRTVWVPEVGRLYWEARRHLPAAGEWDTSEFVFIAREQNRLEDELAKRCDKLLVCDTDAFATTLWHERYLGFASPDVEAVAAGRRCDLYLLTDVDIPFVQDGTRDGEHVREQMHRRFREELTARGKPFVVVTGSHDARLGTAIEAIDRVVRAKRRLSPDREVR